MSPQIILGAIVLAPVALLLLLRINAALVFLSLCLGDVLVQFVAPDANSFVTLFAAHVPKGVDTGNDNIKLLLLLLPVVLTAIFMIRTVRGYGRLALNLLPAAGVGLLGGLLVVPLLPAGTSDTIINSSLWSQVLRAQDLIVGSSALVCLLVLWLQRPKTGGHKRGKHKD
ncbi:MAG TPA: hypothetical protein VK712_04310 [Verrucomicrobiae bacterium]|jgi:hypothetical protein|nr:hypothetical protein [Verrucomicrobiae bacterium]